MASAPEVDSLAEFNVIAQALRSDTEPTEGLDDSHMAPVCTVCGTGGTVATNKMRKGDFTVKRHECQECGARGSSLHKTAIPKTEAKHWSAGEAKEVDLMDDQWEEYRGTF